MHKLALAAVAALALVPSALAVFASDVQAQTVLPPFENVAHNSHAVAPGLIGMHRGFDPQTHRAPSA
jgi:hypothetical protein